MKNVMKNRLSILTRTVVDTTAIALITRERLINKSQHRSVLVSEDAKEGRLALVEKRKPNWTGW